MPDIVTDDEIYRVNAIWMGPPKATMPFRARYVSWGVGIAVSLTVFALARMWFPFGFWSLAWSLVIGVALTRLIGSKITHERPLNAVIQQFVREINTPRERYHITGGAAATNSLRIDTDRPYPMAAPPHDTPSSTAEDTEHANEEAPGA